MRDSIFRTVVFLFISVSLQAQNPAGKWRGTTYYTLKNGRTATHKMQLVIAPNGVISGRMSLEFGGLRFGEPFQLAGSLKQSSGKLRLLVANLAEGPGIQVVMGPAVQRSGNVFLSSVEYDVTISKEGDSLRISGPQSGTEKAEIIFPPNILIRLTNYEEPQEELLLDVQLERLPTASPAAPPQPDPSLPALSTLPPAPIPATPVRPGPVQPALITTQPAAPVVQPAPPVIQSIKPLSPAPAFQKRADRIIRTIVADSNVVELEVYDNGEVDGDSISLFLDEQLVLDRQKISTRPIRQTLVLDPNKSSQLLRMYANNLGSIPPNTAVMIVRFGERKYEVFLSADLEKNAVIELKRKE